MPVPDAETRRRAAATADADTALALALGALHGLELPDPKPAHAARRLGDAIRAFAALAPDRRHYDGFGDGADQAFDRAVARHRASAEALGRVAEQVRSLAASGQAVNPRVNADRMAVVTGVLREVRAASGDDGVADRGVP